jgi:3-O-alpha-D-mannopyranosyl-alpha-D-mannopyranose xylosylphosphotransferase
VYSNDDMFLTAPLELTDYHHPILGPVIRVAGSSGLAITGKLTPDLKSSAGEWGGLEHAGQLLKNRFTPRRRNYMMHMPKAMTKSMVHEASVMFAPQLSLAATRAFRISKRGEADVHFAWLTSQLRIERWREALLWSWAVGRLGGESGVWGKEEQKEVLDLFGIKGDGDQDKLVWFKQEARETIPDVEQIMDAQGWEFPLGSDYVFSSMDGHIPEPGVSYETPRSCGIVPSQCFPALFAPDALTHGIDAESAFRNITFDDHKCGDCLIIGLISKSGPRGLSAILPHEEQTFHPDRQREKQMWDRPEPMLPLVSEWQSGNFTLADVVRPGQDVWEGSEHVESREQDGVIRLRDWCVKLLSRYIYSLGMSSSYLRPYSIFRARSCRALPMCGATDDEKLIYSRLAQHVCHDAQRRRDGESPQGYRCA